LEQVKLYPPYPADEPRRAAVIREFNGIAAEVRKLIGSEVQSLAPTASTNEAEQAVARLRDVSNQARNEQGKVTASVETSQDAGPAAESAQLGTALAGQPDGLSRTITNALREIP